MFDNSMKAGGRFSITWRIFCFNFIYFFQSRSIDQLIYLLSPYKFGKIVCILKFLMSQEHVEEMKLLIKRGLVCQVHWCKLWALITLSFLLCLLKWLSPHGFITFTLKMIPGSFFGIIISGSPLKFSNY